MQLKRKTKRGNFAAALLLTGCFMLTAAHVVMAEGTKVQLDFAKIKQALNKGEAVEPASGMNVGQMPANMPANALAPAANGMQPMQPGPGPEVIGMMDEEMNKMMEKTMGETFISSDIMAEMQKKVMAENMGSIQESVQASVMKSIQGSIQQTAKGAVAK